MLATFLVALLFQSQATSALHIGASSPCYDECDGGTVTETKHLSCLDAAYDEPSGTAAGRQMRECLTCTERSSYSNASDSATDQYWFMCMYLPSSLLPPSPSLQNQRSQPASQPHEPPKPSRNPCPNSVHHRHLTVHLKYTQQYCLFDSAATQISDCAVQCSPLQSVLTTLWGNTSPPRFLYDYCDANSEVYPNYAPDCATCLRNRTGTVVLGNCKLFPPARF